MSRFAKHTIIFSSLTLVSRLSGLLRVMGFAAILGSGRHDAARLNDAYQLANTIPYIIYEFIMGGLLSAIFMPTLVRAQEREGKTSPEAWRVANLLLGYVGVVVAAAAAIVALLSPQFIHLMTYFEKDPTSAESKSLAIYFLRFFAPQMFFYGLSAVFMSILNSHSQFAITAAAPIVNNLVVITTLFIYRLGWIDVTGLAIGSSLGIFAMAAVQVPWLLKVGMPIRPKVNFRDPLFASIGSLGLPIIALAIANFVGTAVRANLLYTVPGGYVTYTFSYILIMMPYGIFAVSIATVLYPSMSRAAVAGDMSKMKDDFLYGLRWTTFIMLPVAVGMSLLSQPLTRALFERENFTYSDSIFFSAFLAFYALSIFPYSVLMFTTRAFYAMNDTRTPAWINGSGVVISIALFFLLMRYMGAPGIALGSTLTYVALMILMVWWLRRRIGRLGLTLFIQRSFRLVVAVAAMAGVVYSLLQFTQPNLNVLERGSRSALRLPADSQQGNAVLIKSDGQWRKLWDAMGKKPDTLPHIDFSRHAVAAIFGPANITTSTLSVAAADLEATSATLAVNVYSRAASETSAGDSPTSPPYLLVQLPAETTSVQPTFKKTGLPPPGLAQRLLRAPDLGRLIMLSVLGAMVYLGVAFLLGANEVESVVDKVRRKLKRT